MALAWNPFQTVYANLIFSMPSDLLFPDSISGELNPGPRGGNLMKPHKRFIKQYTSGQQNFTKN